MRHFLTLVAFAIVLCAGNARADDEFSSARHYPGFVMKWRDIQTRISEDAAHLSICRADPDACAPEETRLFAIVDAARAQEGRARLGHINRAVNLAIRPVSDLARFGEPDRWSAPIDTLRAGGGDCEDYAILKFQVLREAGFADADLKLLIVRQAGVRTIHAVLAARLESEWLVLDSRSFALARLEDSRYRVLSEFAAEPMPMAVAGAASGDLPPLM